jgi:hypothetical protein
VNVDDLLQEASLGLVLKTDAPQSQHDTIVTGCAPTELMDPTPFLEPNSLLLTSGIGMNFSDERTWDAFVERLSKVPVAAIAFSTGIAHLTVPPGLVNASEARKIPLIEVPAAIPPLQLLRHIENLLVLERLDVVTQGWSLADKCARLANQGADVATLLVAIAEVVESPLAVFDAYGSVIAQYPAATEWALASHTKPTRGILSIPLPMGLNNPCQLAVRANDTGNRLSSLLGPVASIIALQLNRSVIVDASRHQEIKNLLDTCESWDEYSHSDVRHAIQAIGLDHRKEMSLLVADVSGEFHSTSWRLRVALHEAFHVVRVTEIDERLVAFVQSPRDDFAEIERRLLGIHARQPLVLKTPTSSLYELRMSVVHSLQLLKRIIQPQLAPELGLGAVVMATGGRGARESAKKFLRPLFEHDEKRSGQLIETLSAFLENDARPTPTCAALFIHRNSLNYRLRKIESFLRVDVNSVEGQATCLIALRLIDTQDGE